MVTCTTPKCKKRLLENDAHTPSPKRARKDLSLEEKLTIADSEKIPKLTQKELSEKYGIGCTTVSDILKKKRIFLLITTPTIMQEIRKGLRFLQNTRN